MRDLGDRPEDGTFNFAFTCYDQTGSPKDPSGIALWVYKDGVQSAKTQAGLSVQSHDTSTVEGLIRVTLALTNAFYVTNADYFIVATAGTVDNVNLSGVCIATFSIANRIMMPFFSIDGAVRVEASPPATTHPDPTTTAFTCTGVTGGKAVTFYADQALLWTSGTLKGLTFFITANDTGSTGDLLLTLQTMPVAPAFEDTFLILGTKGS